jgi:hypothetical protein
MRRVFNDKTIELMRSMAKRGQSAPDIASKIGSTDGSVRVLASRMGIRFQSRVFNNKNVAVMRIMAQQGKSAAQVAKAIGSTDGSVRTLASRLGIRFRSRHKNRKPNDLIQMTVVVSQSTWERLSILARQAGFTSASSLVRNCLEGTRGGSGSRRRSSKRR